MVMIRGTYSLKKKKNMKTQCEDRNWGNQTHV